MTQKAQEVNLKSTEFQPKNEYVLVKPTALAQEKKSESGIVYSLGTNRSVVDRPGQGEVIAVGADIEDIVEGDFILWPGTDGLDLEFNDGVYMLLRYKSIIGLKKRES